MAQTPTKVTITQIATGDPVSPVIANTPHNNLESNIDNILSYLRSNAAGNFEQDSTTTVGLTFGYRAGLIRENNVINVVAAGTVLMTASDVNYVETTSAGIVSSNIVGFTAGSIPLFEVTTNTTSIVDVQDRRSMFMSPTDKQPLDATLTSISALGTAADRFIYTTGIDTWAEGTITAAGRAILDDADVTAQRTTLDVYSKTEVDTLTSGSYDFSENLTLILHPDASRGYEDFYRQGVYPSSFNQQWGGANTGGLPDGSLGEAATGYVVGDGVRALASGAGNEYQAQSFKLPQNTNVANVWIKLYKTGNPVNNLELYIYDDSAGVPNAPITNGTATAQNGKIHTNSILGEWVKFNFPTAPSLTGGTQYHIVCKSSGPNDASNYWNIICAIGTGKYPHGNLNTGNATPTWTPAVNDDLIFLVEPVTTVLKSGGLLGDGKLVPFESTTLNQSAGFYTANDNFINHKRGSFILAGTAFTKDKTILDIGTGTDNNRIVLRTNVTTGYAQIDLYEDDETKHTITGTTDISTGNHVIGFRYRAENDGSDYLTLYVDGVSEGTPLTSQSFLLDKSFKDYGHTTIGGGFGLAPTWTQNLDMSVLPSAAGWTWTGTATEANAMSVVNGILYQNGAGYASTDTGYYTKTTTLNNATGWSVETKLKVKNTTDGVSQDIIDISINDGTKAIRLLFQSYFLEVYDSATVGFVQHNFKEESVVKITGKGSDFNIYINEQLVFDGTGKLLLATGGNSIAFGDTTASATYNGDVEWHYLKYYEGAHLPQYTAAEISEVAYWTEDKSLLFPTIYNAGTIQSVKALAGLDRNYVRERPFKIVKNGIISSPTTTSTSYEPIPEMNTFVLGRVAYAKVSNTIINNTAAASSYMNISVDGIYKSIFESTISQTTGGYAYPRLICEYGHKTYCGLHYVRGLAYVTAGTASHYQTQRTLTVEAN